MKLPPKWDLWNNPQFMENFIEFGVTVVFIFEHSLKIYFLKVFAKNFRIKVVTYDCFKQILCK